MEQFALLRDNYHHIGRHAGPRLSVFRTGLRPFRDRRSGYFKAASCQQRCGCCNHPSQKPTSTWMDILFESSVQAVFKPQRNIDHALVTKQLDNILRALQYGIATLALLEMG